MESKVFIIAEAGVNHNGSLEIAKKMVDVASFAGADAIKFQTFKANDLVTNNAPLVDYQRRNYSRNESQLTMLKKLELDACAYKELITRCKKRNIKFLSTPFDLESVELLYKLGLTVFKIPSGEIDNLLYLRKVGSLKKKVILSTGMATMKEIAYALHVLISSGTKKQDITVLHCNTDYPTPMEDVNLKAMLAIRDRFKVDVGYSDHTLGVEVPIAAVALGACVIEKHFTLDRNMKGPDHKASIEPDELSQMVEGIRHIERALGNGIKKPSQSEIKNIKIARKSIVAASEIRKGEVFTAKNLAVKRPGRGISPMKYDEVIGKTARRNFKPDELIEI